MQCKQLPVCFLWQSSFQLKQFVSNISLCDTYINNRQNSCERNRFSIVCLLDKLESKSSLIRKAWPFMKYFTFEKTSGIHWGSIKHSVGYLREFYQVTVKLKESMISKRCLANWIFFLRTVP